MSVTLHTTIGDVKIELYCEQAPKTCENFLALCASDYYNGCTFHRNIKDFMVQTGDPTNTGKGGQSIWGQPFADELVPDLKSQFFITYAKQPHLDLKYTIFGRVIDGFDALDELEVIKVDAKYRPVVEQSETVSKLDKFANYQKQYEEFYEEMTDEERIEEKELNAEEAMLRARQEREEKRLKMMEELKIDSVEDIINLLSKERARDFVVLEVGDAGPGPIEYIMVCCAFNARHAAVIVEALRLAFKYNDNKPIQKTSARKNFGWFQLEFDNVQVHVIDEEVRDKYDLEGLWGCVEETFESADLPSIPPPANPKTTANSGESPAYPRWITNDNYQYLQFAKYFGADVFMLEHRCFGFSRPYPDMSVEHLRVCTMEQALADVNSFISTMNPKYKFNNPKWITFGGSYSGTLSAMFRLLYPTSTVGAVASSAPLLWTFDFFQYAQVMQDVLNQTDPKCADAVGQAFKNMQDMSLSNGGRDQLNTIFNVQPPFKADDVIQRDIDNFFSNLIGTFQGVIQYTYDGRVNILNNGAQNDPFDNDYANMIKYLRNITFDDENGGDGAANRGWMWLSCNQLGVLQTTNQGRNIFQQTITLNYFIDMCTDVFDSTINIKTMRDNNDMVLDKYGGNARYKGTSVVLPNGSFDPWHVLGSNVSDTANGVTPIMIHGAAHCSDMYPSYDNEPCGLADARTVIKRQIARFLGQS
ncbi:hypothetical protein WR25_00288 [Diploscapter pachys]|uniref:PPIase cyclophilin-type domain-containing protein n=1 Tax=Diploscapter pachys TaxID=2018661 RepID=A0A2A2LMY5_9BILA|nr:hypothetical protein WR25_00288 [Diploscapter pachys]